MNKFIWEDKYSVGISSLDEQHKHFFEIADDIVDLLGRGDFNRDELSALIVKLANHAFVHLKTEEDYFDNLHYLSAPLHVEAHKLYRKKVEDYLQMIQNPNADIKTLADEVATFAIYWLSDHILLMDKQYTVFFREHGVK